MVIPTQKQPSEDSEEYTFFNILLLLFASVIFFSYFKIKRSRSYQQPIMNMEQDVVDDDKIVLAFQIKDFITRYSKKAKKGYLPLQLQDSQNFFVRALRNILGKKHFYRLIFSQNSIVEFFKGLKEIHNVQIILYTSFPKIIADRILKKVKLDSLFPLMKRRYCNIRYRDQLKHPIIVNTNTKRVIIFTPCPYDHTSEDDKYFLLTRPTLSEPQYLKELLKQLKAFIKANKHLDNLHEELSIFKVEYESRYQEN